MGITAARGILVHRSVKPSPAKRQPVTASGDRIGTIAVNAVSPQWVETKTPVFHRGCAEGELIY